MTQLQVLIVAYGRKGIENVASSLHPRMEGVEYIVSWQCAGASPDDVPRSLLERDDFKVLPTPTVGVALNRNLTLDAASAPIVLESDDDVSYTPEMLSNVIRAFDERPDCDFLAFKYYSKQNPRKYPLHECDLRNPPKGYFIGGIEMAFRLDSIRKAGIRFNELFGIGSEFPSGEEDLFLHDVLRAGLTARFVPVVIVNHESESTCMREAKSPAFIRTKGAIHAIVNPRTWHLRMLTHARREAAPGLKEKINYCRNWLRGVRDLRRIYGRHRTFPQSAKSR